MPDKVILVSENDQEEPSKLLLMIDTCVWLDLAKDYRQRPTIAALEELIAADVIELILPRQVVEEFENNKARVIADSMKSLATVFRRVRDALEEFGKPEGKQEALEQLGEVNQRISVLGEGINDAIQRIENLFKSAIIMPTDDAALIAAAERAVKKLAPFHKPKNSIGDAILIELYGAAISSEINSDTFAFVTHNKQDFSNVSVDERQPHPDIAGYFDDQRSVYSISLVDVLNERSPQIGLKN